MEIPKARVEPTHALEIMVLEILITDYLLRALDTADDTELRGLLSIKPRLLREELSGAQTFRRCLFGICRYLESHRKRPPGFEPGE